MYEATLQVPGEHSTVRLKGRGYICSRGEVTSAAPVRKGSGAWGPNLGFWRPAPRRVPRRREKLPGIPRTPSVNCGHKMRVTFPRFSPSAPATLRRSPSGHRWRVVKCKGRRGHSRAQRPRQREVSYWPSMAGGPDARCDAA